VKLAGKKRNCWGRGKNDWSPGGGLIGGKNKTKKG